MHELSAQEQQQLLEQLKFENLRREIQIGIDQADRGELISLEERRIGYEFGLLTNVARPMHEPARPSNLKEVYSIRNTFLFSVALAT